MKEVKLIVAEAKQRDIGRGIARIDGKSMKKIGVNANEHIEIIGESRTVAVAWPSYVEDKNKGIVRIDGFIRKNAGLPINEHALVRRIEVKDAQKIILAPIDMRLNVDTDFIGFVKNRIMERAFFEGDTTLVMMLGHAMPFGVVRAKPHNVPVRVTLDTILSILNEPIPEQPKAKVPFDIKYLLRVEWLNNLAARIRATRIIFSIADHAISDEEEQKVTEAARKIAIQDLSNVRVEVNFESGETIIGTLPWVEVDLWGRVSAIYPDVQLPPLPPSITSKGASEEIIPPMKRCFKTGVENCPKEINFSPGSIVVAMPFGDDFKDAYTYAIRPALEEAGFKPWKADEQINNIDIMCKICQAIQESGYVLANITDWNPNVVFELGLAYGLAKNVILIKHKKAQVPVDLKGLEYIEYSTIDELKRNLLLFLKGSRSNGKNASS